MIALALYALVMVCLTAGYLFTLISLKEKHQAQEEQKPETKQDKPRKQLQEYEHI